MTDALVTWLSRALDHAEDVARAAMAGLEHHAGYGDWAWWEEESDSVVAYYGDGGRVTDDLGNGRLARHIALHDPRAVLARVEAERAILRRHADAVRKHAWNAAELAKRGTKEYCRIDEDAADMIEREGETALDETEEVVRLLAWGHRHDVPGFDMSWAPEGARAGANAG